MNPLDRICNVHNGVATMHIFDEIGGDGISGSHFAGHLQFLNEQPEIKEIRILINSEGGSVTDGFSMFSAIRSSEKPVTTIAAGLVASTAGFVFMGGHTRKMNDIARLMIHGLTVKDENGGEIMSLSEEDKALVTNMRDMIAQIFENNSKQSFTDMVAMLSRTTFIKAEQALSMGLIDEIIDTKRKNIKFVENAMSKVYNQYNEVLKPENKTIRKMKNVCNHLNLTDDASESSVIDTVKKIENQVATEKEAKTTAETALEVANKRIGELETENTELKSTATTAQDSEAVAFVENAIKEGKFSEDKKDGLIVQAKADLKGFKNLTESIVSTGPNLISQINNKVKVDGVVEGKTLRQLEKESPAVVKNMLENNIEEYKKLYKAEYGTEYVEETSK